MLKAAVAVQPPQRHVLERSDLLAFITCRHEECTVSLRNTMETQPTMSTTNASGDGVPAEYVSDIASQTDLSEEESEDRIDTLINEYKVPWEEARKSLLGEYGAGGNTTADPTAVTLDELEAGDHNEGDPVSTEGAVKVVDDWGESDNGGPLWAGLVADEFGDTKLTVWDDDLPDIEEGDVINLENVLVDKYEGRYSVKANEQSEMTFSDEDVDPGSGLTRLHGQLVRIKDGSGVIKRCPVEDCTNVLDNGRCSDHGPLGDDQDPEYDLRIKADLDTGFGIEEVIFGTEATESLIGMSVDEAVELCKDELDMTIIKRQLRDHEEGFVGEYMTVGGNRAYGRIFVEEYEFGIDIREQEDTRTVSTDPNNSEDTIAEEARRVFAAELDDTETTFRESEGEMAALFGLLPTGEKANRVTFTGTLTEVEDVGDDSVFMQARVAGPTGTVRVQAGQYQEDAQSTLKHDLEAPEYVTVIGKLSVDEDDGTVFVSIRAEAVTIADEERRNTFVEEAASQTLDRIERDSEYAERAQEEYDTQPENYRSTVEGALDEADIDVSLDELGS